MSEKASTSKDPIVYGSLGPHIFIASLVLVASTFWAIWDEIYTKRPWKGYQAEFRTRYTNFLEEQKLEAEAFEGGLVEHVEVAPLRARLVELEAVARPEIERVDRLLNSAIGPRVAQLTKEMTVLRSEVTALTYKLEHADDAGKARLRAEIDAVKNKPILIEAVPKLDGSGAEAVSYAAGRTPSPYDLLAASLDEAKARKASLIRERARLANPARELRAEIATAEDRLRPGLSAQQLAGLLRKMETDRNQIRQIHIPDPIGLVDRCETCHLGVREPIDIPADRIGGELADAFVSHPTRVLLDIHDPEQFGCTPCHGGNGAATISVKEGHGKIKHWLWPLYDMENVDAGCLQCHEDSLVLAHAPTLNAGKEIFRHRGCWGCHPREGFDVERSQRRITAQAIDSLERTISELQREYGQQDAIASDYRSTDEQMSVALDRMPLLQQEISGLESEMIELYRKKLALDKQVKNVGPSLRVVQAKLKPDWITPWINNPREFRPNTRMPVFRLDDDTVKAIAAAIWQNAEPQVVPTHPEGDVTKGKELVAARGCLACHATEKDAAGDYIGGVWGPTLDRLGEKADYNYIVEWVHDTPDWSVMPNLRLTIEESRNIASYLMTLRNEDAQYDDDVAHLSDPALKERGEMLIRHYGCAGCHDIAGFDTVGKIGTELTTEGNKPIERLDFALHTHSAKRNKHDEDQIQYNHKSFFGYKLRQPEYFDEGRVFDDPLAKSRMPNFGLDDQETRQVVTYLLGSVDSDVPEALKYNPTGPSKAIVDGWWVIQKYNCQGCHEVMPGQVPVIQTLPQFSGENAGYAPPSLVNVGARLNPEWLAKFLRDPALNDHDPHRNGVRSYLQVRMPTFNLYDEEIGKLVAFFEALSSQNSPYFPPHYPVLTEEERNLGRQAFLNADCLNCHASAEQREFDPTIIAPSFVHTAGRLKPTWTERWLWNPQQLMIGTRMPSELFRQDGDRRVVAGAMSDELAAYDEDHIKLFVRYMNTIDEREAEILKAILDEQKTTAATDEEEFMEDEEEEFLDEDE